MTINLLLTKDTIIKAIAIFVLYFHYLHINGWRLCDLSSTVCFRRDADDSNSIIAHTNWFLRIIQLSTITVSAAARFNLRIGCFLWLKHINKSVTIYNMCLLKEYGYRFGRLRPDNIKIMTISRQPLRVWLDWKGNWAMSLIL